MGVSAGWNEKSALGKKNKDKKMNEPISVVLKNNRQGIGHKSRNCNRTVGLLNNNDSMNMVNGIKQNKTNIDNSTGNTCTKKMKRKKTADKIQQEKIREKKIRME